MKRKLLFLLLVVTAVASSIAFKNTGNADTYTAAYLHNLQTFQQEQQTLLQYIEQTDLSVAGSAYSIRAHIQLARYKMKSLDFWFRYLEPIAYKRINGPLPVEWETEVFEKFEKPYKREGTGLTLAALYLDEENPSKDSLISLIKSGIIATSIYDDDSITKELQTYHHFFLCNRLYILNLAAIYTTGFECPDTSAIIPELKQMMTDVNDIYQSFNLAYPNTPLTAEYTSLYNKAMNFVKAQPPYYSSFDHYTFLRDYVNPMFTLNQKMINQYKVVSHSLLNYSLNKQEISIFNKALYTGQNAKGLFLRVTDSTELAEIEEVGKLLFYDPILSGNNLRSCASCHKPTEFFTDTTAATALAFDRVNPLPRNTPSLINVQYNHLAMMDGKHISLQHQTKDVITNHAEMNCSEKEVLEKILSCKEYDKAFKNLMKHTPQEKEITIEHISSAITYYYAKFGKYYSPFDEAMNTVATLEPAAKKGFNLFMSKAQCATCHFVPQFNGVKPPYIGSEFEVLGTPADTGFKALSSDKGRYGINPAHETLNAFRTGSIRNAQYTKPYMHNGVFKDLDQLIEFYNNGGGAGRGLQVGNQTLSSDSLHLNKTDKQNLVAFITSLNEKIAFEQAPAKLPSSKNKALNNRKVGGEY